MSIGAYCANGPEGKRKGMSAFTANVAHHDFDAGGAILPHGIKAVDHGYLAFDKDDAVGNRETIRKAVCQVLEKNAVPIVLGGDDSIPIPMLESVCGAWVVHFPADRCAYRLARIHTKANAWGFRRRCDERPKWSILKPSKASGADATRRRMPAFGSCFCHAMGFGCPQTLRPDLSCRQPFLAAGFLVVLFRGAFAGLAGTDLRPRPIFLARSLRCAAPRSSARPWGNRPSGPSGGGTRQASCRSGF